MKTKVPKIKKWESEMPEKCDICDHPLEEVFVDGKTSMGPWAIMCEGCHLMQGGELGTGKGQLYSRGTI